MKKLIALLLVLTLALSSFVLLACDDETDDDGKDDPSTEGSGSGSGSGTGSGSGSGTGSGSGSGTGNPTPEPEPEPEPEGPVPVDKVNGMNARELLENFFEEFSMAESYDFTGTMTSIVEGVSSTMKIDFKLNETNAYIKMISFGSVLEMWHLDGTTYLNTDGEKIVTTEVSTEEFFSDMLVFDLSEYITDDFITKADTAQIYLEDGIYSFSITVTKEEAEDFEFGEAGTETYYFNENGKIIKILDETEEGTLILDLNSYGGTVTVNPPEDADEYVSMDDIGDTEPDPGDQDPETYAFYVGLTETIKYAETFSWVFTMDGEPYMFYENDGVNKYAAVYEEGSLYELWIIGDDLYASIDGSTPVMRPISDDDLSMIEFIEMIKAGFTEEIIVGDDMTNLILDYDEVNEEVVLAFDVVYFEGYYDVYEFRCDSDVTYITVTITTMSEGEVESEASFTITNIDDPELTIQVPV